MTNDDSSGSKQESGRKVEGRKKPTKPGKFTVKYKKPDGRASEVSGEVTERGASLLDLVSTALCFGEDSVPGLKELLDGYVAACEQRKVMYEALRATGAK